MKHLLFFLVFFIMFSSWGLDAVPLDKQWEYFDEKFSVQGGEITDGKNLGDIRWGRHADFERLVLDIHKSLDFQKGPAAEVPCYFTVKYEYYPYRLTVELNGIRSREAEFGDLICSQYIERTYSLPYLDDSGIMFSIALNKPVKIEVFELHSPGRIVIDIAENEFPQKLQPVFSVRTKTGLGIEELRYLQERAGKEEGFNPRIIKGENGELFLEAGFYNTLEKAQSKMAKISSLIEGRVFFIEERGPACTPGP